MPNRQTVIGFDLGGTKSAVAVYDKNSWEELSYERIATNADRGFSAVLDGAMTQIEKVWQKDTIGVGFGVAGLLAHPEGLLLSSPNIPGSVNIPLKKLLTARFNTAVEVENDSRCFTLAEAVAGAGKGKRVVVGVTMGTGVGGGIIIEGKVMHGEHGFAGEIGHMLLRPGEPPFPTKDIRGEAEQFFSGTAMGKRCAAANKPEEYLEGQACSFLHPHLFREIAWMVTNLTYAVDPSIIVFGGSAGLALKPHLKEIRAELRNWLLPHTPEPELATAMCAHPGTLGAALLLRGARGVFEVLLGGERVGDGQVVLRRIRVLGIVMQVLVLP